MTKKEQARATASANADSLSGMTKKEQAKATASENADSLSGMTKKRNRQEQQQVQTQIPFGNDKEKE